MQVKINSIYKQLLANIILPVIICLLIIGIFSFRNTKTILRLNNETEQNFIYDEIKSFIELQFVALTIIEEPMANLMQEYSTTLVDEYFDNTFNIENTNLNSIQNELEMDKQNVDIYVINRDGIVVNTTFREDLYFNFYSFSEAHKNYLLEVFSRGEFDSPKFFFEHKTKRYKKYSYHPTNDGKYIIEIGLYSTQADQIYDYMISHLENIPNKKPNLVSVDLFFLASGKPYPLNLKHEFIPDHLPSIPKMVEGEVVTIPFEKENNDFINYTYFYLEDTSHKIFNGNIIRIANDTTTQLNFIKKEKRKILFVLIIALALFYFIIYFRAKMIVHPIQHLIEKSKIIANGNYRERVVVEGDNELSLLSENFNKMVNNIEERNNQIEQQSEFLYQSNRKLNEAYKLLDHQKNLIENKQDDLTASINYAQRIQDSLLPQPEDFAKLFQESFVYILPRDIVSGDFYWFSKVNNKLIIVASDCTGHGVPGAFMSMIGMTILNHLVNYEHIDDPALIISRLDAEICDLLIYNNHKEQRFEGMDTAVCSVDLETNEMKFSSAQRPIILMRNGEAITYKGSIYPIGEYYDSIQKIFTNTSINLEENDTVYMFSDGYTSQFEESGAKKFNYRRFRKLLTDINSRPLKEHPVILDRTLNAWKGTAEQIDDIMVLGFKYSKNKVQKKFSAMDIINSDY